MELELEHPALAFLWRWGVPEVAFDGGPVQRLRWGRHRVTVPHGAGRLRIEVALFGFRLGAAQTAVDDTARRLIYRAPWLVHLRGAVGADPKFPGGRLVAGLAVASVLLMLAPVLVVGRALSGARSELESAAGPVAPLPGVEGTEGPESSAAPVPATTFTPTETPLPVTTWELDFGLSDGYEVTGTLNLGPPISAMSPRLQAQWELAGGGGVVPCVGSSVSDGVFSGSFDDRTPAVAVGRLTLRNGSAGFEPPSRMTFWRHDKGETRVGFGLGYSTENDCKPVGESFLTPNWQRETWSVPVAVLYEPVFGPASPQGDRSVVESVRLAISAFSGRMTIRRDGVKVDDIQLDASGLIGP